jgi:2-C-methyl-D-erythritol 2,4-cyclodiphosphate synthase
MGGVNLAHDRGAFGHSDADVLLHAICDAILGAANLRDIGFHFPNTDDKWKGVSSMLLLQEVMKLIAAKNFTLGNIDCMICLEAPKINPHIPEMKTNIATAIGISEEDISIKATTNEQMGFIGRAEGVVAYAVVLLEKTI